MKIAIFSDTFPPHVDGVANVVERLASILSSRGHKVQVVTISKKTAAKGAHQASEKYDIIRLPSVSAAFVYKGHRFTLPIGQLIFQLEKNKPDIIHTHTQFTVGWEAVQSARVLKIPIVGTNHTFYDHYLKHVRLDFNWMKKLTWKYTVGYYNRCDLVLSPSRALADVMKAQKLKKPVEIIPNPINLDFFQPPSNQTARKKFKAALGISGKSIVYMGRVSYEKNIDKALRAFALILKKKPKLKFVIVGDGQEKRRLEELANRLNIQKSTIFTGFLSGSKLVEALQANELFLTASKSENMPLSVLEAMACGLPVVAVAALGIPEIVREGENGLLARSDDPEELAKNILKLLDNEQMLAKFSKMSHRLAENYLPEKICQMHEDVYNRVIASYW